MLCNAFSAARHLFLPVLLAFVISTVSAFAQTDDVVYQHSYPDLESYNGVSPEIYRDELVIELQALPSNNALHTRYKLVFKGIGSREITNLDNYQIRLDKPLLYVPNTLPAKLEIVSKEESKALLADAFLLDKVGKYFKGQKLRPLNLNQDIMKSLIKQHGLDALQGTEIEIQFEPYCDIEFVDKTIPAHNAELISTWESLYQPSPFSSKANSISKNSEDNQKIALEAGTALKIPITETAIYRLTASELKAAGFDLQDSKANRLVLLSSGGSDMPQNVDLEYINSLSRQPLEIKMNGGKIESITFLGQAPSGWKVDGNEYEHYLNTYTTKSNYILTYATEDLEQIPDLAIPEGEAVNFPNTYTYRTFHEVDKVNGYDFGGGRDFLGEVINGGKLFTDQVYDILPGTEIEYLFSVAHRNTASDEKDRTVGQGTITIEMNGESYPQPIVLGNTAGSYTSYVRRIRSHKLPASSITGGASNIFFNYSSSNIQGAGYLDYYTLAYQRSMKAIDNSIKLFANPDTEGITEYSIEGFAEGKEKYVFDITDPNNPRKIPNLSNTGNRVVFKVDRENKPGIYFASCDVKKPNTEPVTLTGLSSRRFEGTDMLVITHPDLRESAEAFKEYRELQSGLSISIVNITDIFNEFGGGNNDVMAIRNFLAYHFNQMDKPFEYVTYWGHGHYDHRQLNYTETNLVPTFQSNERDFTVLSETDNMSTDDIFSEVTENFSSTFLPSFAQGRIPVRSNEEGFAFIRKLDRYENNSDPGMWRQTVLLTADDGWGDKSESWNLHMGGSETISNEILPPSFYQEKIYLAEFEHFFQGNGDRGRKGANQALINFINKKGASIVNWTGHGNPGVWAHEGFFIVETGMPQLTNKGKLPYVIAATCDFSRFDHPVNVSGGEKFVLKEDGGSIAILAASRLVYVSSNQALSNDIYREQTKLEEDGSYPAIGKAVLFAKYDGGNGSQVNDAKYFLFGDPSMKLVVPTNRVVVDQINGSDVSAQDSIILKGLQEVHVVGHMSSPTGEEMSDFNGIVRLIVHDGDIEVVETDLDNKTYYFSDYGGALSKITLPVTNGRFQGSFFLPKDISYSENNGRMFFYGEESDGPRTAKGNFNSFYISGIDQASSIIDKNGPEIKLYMDHPDFQSCDEVAPTTTLFAEFRDESGINATGVGIGHKLEAWIGTGDARIDLSENYDTSLEDPKLASSYAILEDLEPGQYTISVRAWDIFNNFTVASTCFTVEHPADREGLVSTYPYPNPFTESNTLRVQHMLPLPFDVSVKIADATGKVVDSFTYTLSDPYYADIPWNPASRGVTLTTGSYFYTVQSIGTEILNPDDDNIVYGSVMYIKE